MNTFQLTISPEYVAGWGIWEGVRELLQNAIDQQTRANPMRADYSSTGDGVLTIANKNTKLSRSTLLLGHTDKRGAGKIGKWGEGYKLAFLCLLRNGIGVEVRNGNEIWRPKFVNSRTFKSRVLAIDVTRTTSTAADLEFILTGINAEHYADIVQKYLGLCEVGETINSQYGRALLNEKWRGKVFVSGLYVCEMKENMRYGYDMSPGSIELDRDRNKVESFNLFWETSRIYASLKGREYAELIHDLGRYEDAKYYETHADGGTELFKEICELNYSDFVKAHGRNAIPVENDTDARAIREKYNDLVPVVMPQAKMRYLNSAPSMKRTGRSRVITESGERYTPFRVIERVLKKHKKEIPAHVVDIIREEILEPSHDWTARR